MKLIKLILFYVINIIAFVILLKLGCFDRIGCTDEWVPSSEERDYVNLKKDFNWINKNIYNIIIKESKFYKFDKKLLCSLVHAESMGNTYAVSRSGALGLMQVIPKYHYKNNPDHLFIPEINIKIGMKYLDYCRRKAKGDIVKMLIYYNAGCNSNISKYRNWIYIDKIVKKYRGSTNDGASDLIVSLSKWCSLVSIYSPFAEA